MVMKCIVHSTLLFIKFYYTNYFCKLHNISLRYFETSFSNEKQSISDDVKNNQITSIFEAKIVRFI